ncbi:hypothetical protein ABB02_00861 [Clostridiaceae bacterium JG1575]|nr:hypothetical protein ABB02_00861 [Clostridiaceae bacterium JG1575]
MHQRIFDALAEHGFFEANGLATRQWGRHQYTVRCEGRTLVVERPFAASPEERQAALNVIQSLAPRYSLQRANVEVGFFRITLTAPGQSPEEEAQRIDFLIRELEGSLQEPASKSPSAPLPNTTPKSAYRPSPSAPQKDPTPRKEPVPSPKRARYLPPEQNPYIAQQPVDIPTQLMDRSFHGGAALAALLGGLLGAALMALMAYFSFPPQPFAFFLPLFIFFAYRWSSHHQMPIFLALALLLLSLFAASIFTNSLDYSKSHPGQSLDALLFKGLSSHWNCEEFLVATVWLNYLFSLLAAAIPALLLLTMGWKKHSI